MRVATTAGIAISTALNNGDVIDGVTLATDDRVLVKDQSSAAQNGIYIVGASPARAYDQSTDDAAFAFLVYVVQGTIGGGNLFRNTNTTAPTIGADAITFEEVTGGTGTLFYNVQDYGALGDGTTDDTAAIEATRDASDATNGGIIYFPPTASAYKITSLISFTSATSKYHLLGGGARYGSARVHQATSNTGAFKFNPSGGTADRVLAPLVESLVVSGTGSASTSKGLEFLNDGHVRDCFVYGFYRGLEFSTASFYSFIKDTTVTDCDDVGILLSSCNNFTIDSCRVLGDPGGVSAPIGALTHGIRLVGGLMNRIVNSSIEYFIGEGIEVQGGGPITIQGNYFETQQSSSSNAHLWLGRSSATYNAWVVDNYFQGDGTSGFYAINLDNAVAFHILSNRFGVNSAIGINHTGGSSLGFAWGNYNSPAGTFNFPSDTITSPGAASFATPSIALGSSAAGGAASTVIRSDATIAAFDATAPVTQAIGDSAAVGSAAFAARRDHKHGMPAFGSPVAVGAANADGTAVTIARSDHVHLGSTGAVGPILIADTHSTPLVFADLLQNDAQDDLLYADT